MAGKGGANATAKVLVLVAGMICGADSITDTDLLPQTSPRIAWYACTEESFSVTALPGGPRRLRHRW